MITTLLISWLVVVSIQLIYILFVFSRTAFYQANPPALPASPAGVTILVCAHNERENLEELIPILAAQQYPTFEVLIMDDRSTDGSHLLLEQLQSEYPRLQSIRIDKEHEHVTPKKYALTIGLKKAQYPTVLLTDADCRPASTEWLSTIITNLANSDKQLVLGFSPYEKRPGFLNLLIRAETLFTAVQYFSLALAGKPYMGVGRNLSYRTQLFFANKGFYTHKNVLGGDDDLFVNEVATSRNTAVCLDPATFTWSKPKETWPDWQRQKQRHLHVGKYYKLGHKIRLGLLTGSHVLTWLLGLVVGLLILIKEVTRQPFTPFNWFLLLIASGVFGLRLLLFWGIVGRISYRLAHTVHAASMPFVDLLLGLYYGLAGIKTLFTRRNKRYYWR